MSRINQILDQRWAEARDWARGQDKETLLWLCNLLADEDETRFVREVQKDRALADVVSRLALVALQEATVRAMRAVVEDETTEDE